MINIKTNVQTVISNLLSQLSALNPGGTLNNAMVEQGYNTLLPLIIERVHTNGIATDGSAIGSTLVRTGHLRDGFKAMPEGLGWSDDTLGQRAIKLEEKYGKELWGASADEKATVTTLAQNMLNNAFSGK